MPRICVLGAGSWGTALAAHLARGGHDVRLWGRAPDLVAEMRERRVNPSYLPEVALPAAISVTHEVECAVEAADFVVCAVPTHGARSVLRMAAPFLRPSMIAVSATKGLELDTWHRMSEVIAEVVPCGTQVVVLSGPSFALEVARELPTAVVAASTAADAARRVQEEFRARYLRIYASDDVVGVEIGGALKNVIAIAAGVVEGLGLGHNALAALITRGLVEISRLASVLGGRRETLSGLAGLGDLVLTCTGDLSRNRGVGIELGRGRALGDVLAGMKMVAEGVRTTSAALALGARHGVELPIAAQMAEVLSGRQPPAAAVERLMLRPQRAE
ncbi:MAG: NAD(P)-dependent glycerol-3-phosphate dehydrogenase [Acidobacteria bacterium]|nr:NAD(P)-dependent glycerol-3-phosphate dehydrogenase [Acidobacteriota bacterium]